MYISLKNVRACHHWVERRENWECPCCCRKKDELLRPDRHGIMMGILHEHHDHITDYRWDNFDGSGIRTEAQVTTKYPGSRAIIDCAYNLVIRFDDVVICQDCNVAEGAAKLQLETPKPFSFAPPEIARFIRRRKNAKHEIVLEWAREIWGAQEQDYHRRVRLLEHFRKMVIDRNYWTAGYDNEWERYEPPWQQGEPVKSNLAVVK